ncbi:MAG: fumarylacetoacetate hydrolase family protein [Trueperaceae bacterium]|nr:fumarylacetoacetate hydrolase family protein [Trueperaceae bacterium]
MRIVRYASPEGPRHGLIEGDTLYAAEGAPGALRRGAVVGPLAEATLLAPVEPTTIVCVGNNYDELLAAKGLERPEIPNVFLKAANTIVGPDADVVAPAGQRFEFEGELALVIGATARKVAAADWRDYVLGFTIANDLTARDWQLADTQWWRAKSSDTFCPVGPWIDTDYADPETRALQTLVNGEVKQDASTADLTFKLGEVLEIVTASLTLQPGDLVLTGTPPGFCPLHPGDVVEVRIDGLGALRNTVVAG